MKKNFTLEVEPYERLSINYTALRIPSEMSIRFLMDYSRALEVKKTRTNGDLFLCLN
ncbi:MAG: hypothetical protein Q7J34_01350 [Bacteroidales bacterium]|nr:hypothetical protein [Bacteroidales bacterium]